MKGAHAAAISHHFPRASWRNCPSGLNITIQNLKDDFGGGLCRGLPQKPLSGSLRRTEGYPVRAFKGCWELVDAIWTEPHHSGRPVSSLTSETKDEENILTRPHMTPEPHSWTAASPPTQ
jgi:hypothetical protein